MVKKHACKAKLGEWSSFVGKWPVNDTEVLIQGKNCLFL